MAGLSPPQRYFWRISSILKGGHASSFKYGPSSSMTTSKPFDAKVIAVTAPPGPEPMTATWHRMASAIAFYLPRRGSRARLQGQHDKAGIKLDQVPARPASRAAPALDLEASQILWPVVEQGTCEEQTAHPENSRSEQNRSAEKTRHLPQLFDDKLRDVVVGSARTDWI